METSLTIPSNPIANFYESSNLASQRDPRNLGRQWGQHQAILNASRQAVNAAANTARLLAKARRSQVSDLPYPFQITLSPLYKLRVRGGLVLGYGYANGTDNQSATTDPDSTIGTMSGGFDLWLPGVADNGHPNFPFDTGQPVYYVWLEYFSGSVEIHYGLDPTATSGDDGSAGATNPWTSSNPWTTYPTRDGKHAMIGQVEQPTAGMFVVRQFLDCDFDPVVGGGAGDTEYLVTDISGVPTGIIMGVPASTPSGTPVAIAIPAELRPPGVYGSPLTATTAYPGITATFSYSYGIWSPAASTQRRMATGTDGNTYYEYLTPPIWIPASGWPTNATRIQVEAENPGFSWAGGAITLTMKSDGRQFAWDPNVTS